MYRYMYTCIYIMIKINRGQKIFSACSSQNPAHKKKKQASYECMRP